MESGTSGTEHDIRHAKFTHLRKRYVEWVLEAANYDLMAAALVLDLTVTELRYCLKHFQIHDLAAAQEPNPDIPQC